MRLVLFGAPTIERDDTAFALPCERRCQLVAFLALKRAWVTRAELASLLWPDQAQKLAFTNLRKSLFRLASAPWAPQIEAEGGSLRLEIDTDVAAFEGATSERNAASAVGLYRGDLLAGFDDDDNDAWTGWLAFERQRLRNLWREAALARLTEDIEATEGIELSGRLLEADPLDEAAVSAQIACLSRSGQAARARRVYREFGERLEHDLGVRPSPALNALHDSLGGTSHPVAKPGAARSDGFVGRAVELRRIAALMPQGECRLLTLVGPGGAGKTRLARRAGDELQPAFRDGAVFVPLEDVTTGKELAARIAREIGATLKGGKDPLAQVIESLKARHALLVLDNFEQLAREAPTLQAMLAACPHLRLIVTSRVRLGVQGEWLLPVEGLPCPENEDRDRLDAFDASRLFVQAAQRVEPALVPTVEAEAIVEICRLVEGLPLALELAATWTRVLSCDAIAAELRKGSSLLHDAEAADKARHASFATVFDQSWQLLVDRERDVLSRLAVFRGGFTPEAAREVAGSPLAILGSLADKSLLRKEGGRLFMHPLVAQSAGTKLDAASRRGEAERAHATYFDALLARVRLGIEHGDRDALVLVETELDNCVVAWRWSGAHDEGGMLMRLADVILYFTDHLGRHEEGLALLREALESHVARTDVEVEAKVLAFASHLEYRLDRYPQAIETAKRALVLSSRGKPARLKALSVLAACNLRLGRHDDAKRFYYEALNLSPESEDPRNAAALLDNVALVEKEQGNYDESLALALRSLNAHRRLRDAAGESLCLNNLGALYLDRRDYQSAGAHLREGLAIAERHGLVSTRGLLLANLTEHAFRSGDLVAARGYAERALDVARTAGNRSVESWLLLQLVRLALRNDDLAQAREHLAASLELAVAVASPSLQMAGVVCFAEVAAAQCGAECARQILTFAEQLPATTAAQAAEIRTQIAQLPPSTSAAPPWPGIGFDELVHRIRTEASIAYGPLLAALRSAA